jgi:hypothetical protein
LARNFYPLAIRSTLMWPFDASCYWYSVGLLLYLSSYIATYLPKSILVSLY